ncbi:MAG TPA: tetratricopeptide repeat protein [Gammaproteobacteria bacterium]|nr:tetratricopeptide repeat protein [Gammaproteobacteria bacterium]
MINNNHSVLAVLLVIATALAGCTTHSVRPDVNAMHFLHDAAFPASNQVNIETRREVFRLDESTREYLDEKTDGLRNTHVNTMPFVNVIIQSMETFSYNNSATTTAAQTFHNREANCLSMTILAFAMADYLGFDVSFRYVEIPEYWMWREQNSLVSRHVNLILKPVKTDEPVFGFIFSRPIEIDFFAPGSSQRYGSHKISDSTILAMFYNNKGAVALLSGKPDIAYAYLRAAVLEDPTLDMAISNLALLYTKAGKLEWAESNYREIIKRNPNNTAAAQGLAVVMRMQGRYKEAAAIIARIERERANNPYYHYVLGEQAYAANKWNKAIHAFKRALDLRPDLDQAYFGLAKSYYQLGDIDWARANLKQAKRNASREEAKKRYESKLALLTR